ncbi:hypothetical protein BJV82DRAFT_658011 [Fennellomyces sp. T-0311]|nr:hypothetical protein BJV82DRAFT_658011 [Fennellomyces sp. T-0311]
MTYTIPVVDFSDFDNRSSQIAEEILCACKTIGFFYVVNHSVPLQQVSRAFEISKEFYDLPYEEKTKYKINEDNHGYTGLLVQRKDEPYSLLPDAFLKNKGEVEGFARACHSAAMQILKAFSIALKIPEEEGGLEWFHERHRYDVPLSSELLRFLKYPRGGEASYKDPVRTGAHTDYGSITLLFQKDIDGLEVQASRTEWISAPLIKDSVLVNVGGVMEYWTNGLFKSTLHRVVFKPEHQGNDRYSIAYFVQPEKDVSLAPIPGSVIPKERPEFEDIPNDRELKVMDYMQIRYEQSYGKK